MVFYTTLREWGTFFYLTLGKLWATLAYPMTNNKSPSTAKAIETHFMVTMPPRLLQTDGGSEYQSHFMGKLATYRVKHHLTVPHRPKSKGVAEAAVKLVKEGILRLITRAGESRKNWWGLSASALTIQ
jgi:hypothetical protein